MRIIMRGKGVIAVAVMCILLAQMPLYVSAGRTDTTMYWDCGLKIGISVENLDYWTTFSDSEIYFTLTLRDAGNVTSFHYLKFRVWLVTEKVDYQEMDLNELWNGTGESIRLVAKFNVAPDEINNSAWETYTGSFFYNYSLGVTISQAQNMELYTRDRQGTPLTISVIPFIVFWPFPPIILALVGFWSGFFILRRFNRRYAKLKEAEPKETW